MSFLGTIATVGGLFGGDSGNDTYSYEEKKRAWQYATFPKDDPLFGPTFMSKITKEGKAYSNKAPNAQPSAYSDGRPYPQVTQVAQQTQTVTDTSGNVTTVIPATVSGGGFSLSSIPMAVWGVIAAAVLGLVAFLFKGKKKRRR